MLATRIIPTILSKNGHLIKDRNFKQDRVVGNALQAAKIHASRGVDELIILDITATQENRPPDYEMVKRLSGSFSPLTVGGGVKLPEHVNNLLRAGADKVSICSEAVWKPRIIRDLSTKYGSSTIVISIDVKDGRVRTSGNRLWGDPVKWAKIAEEEGAGEILLTSVDRDGTMDGYDIDLIKDVSQAVRIPVVASGGCDSYEDMLKAILAGASGVACGSMFQFDEKTPKGASDYLKEAGIEVRV